MWRVYWTPQKGAPVGLEGGQEGLDPSPVAGPAALAAELQDLECVLLPWPPRRPSAAHHQGGRF